MQQILEGGWAARGRFSSNAGWRHPPRERDQMLVFWGLHPKLGPIARMGPGLEPARAACRCGEIPDQYPGIFAVGDINDYPGKKKLILSGFHETALAAFAIHSHLEPGKNYISSTPPRARSCIVGWVSATPAADSAVEPLRRSGTA